MQFMNASAFKQRLCQGWKYIHQSYVLKLFVDKCYDSYASLFFISIKTCHIGNAYCLCQHQ